MRSVKRVFAAVREAQRKDDLALDSAALTGYAAVSLIPFAFLSAWIASKLLTSAAYASGSAGVIRLIGDASGLGGGIRELLAAADRAPVGALITAAIISALYGEAFARVATAVRGRRRRTATFVRARVKSVFALAAGGGLLALSLLAGEAIGRPLLGDRTTFLDVYVRFLLIWGFASVMLVICYRAFGRGSLSPLAIVLSATAAGSWVAGSTLGYLYVLGLGLNFGAPFAGSTPAAVAVLVLSWLFLNHLAVLVAYSAAVLLTEEGRPAPAAVPA